VYSTNSAPATSTSPVSSVSSSIQKQSVTATSINSSAPSSLPSVPTSSSSVSFDNKRYSTGSINTTNNPPSAISSNYDHMNNPMATSKATAAPSNRSSMPVTTSSSVSNPFGANPFSDNPFSTTTTATSVNPFGETTNGAVTSNSAHASVASATTSQLSISSSMDSKRLSVKALYDHEAEEEDELNFKAGDIVEVVEKLEGGWWRGSCRGKEGLFPSNYVKNP